MTRVVVTGANGFIGTWSVGGLLDRGYRVLGLDLDMQRLTRKFGEHENLETVRLDVTDKGISDFISAGDKVLHLAAVAHYVRRKKAAKAVHVNVVGTCNVLEACLEKRAERIVYSSTGSVYSQDVKVPIGEGGKTGPSYDNYYGWSKLQAEQWIKIYGRMLPYVILRYGYVYGALKDWGAIGDWVYHKIPEGKQPEIYGGRQTNDFVYVKDVVQANILALESERLNEIYNIGTGRATSILDAYKICASLMNSSLRPKITPARGFDFPVFVYDISRAQKLLNYEPEWSIEKGVMDMV